MVQTMEARLVEWREIGPEVRHFLFEIPGVEKLDFVPGQFLSVSGERNGRKVIRAYSIASPPGGNRFELCLNRVKEGVFSPHLFELEPGDRIQVKGPYGVFTLRTPGSDALFVATGTGIAPFRSMLWAHESELAGHRITLLFGARRDSGLLYREEFERLERRWLDFRFLPTLTRPEPDWKGLRGRVQQHLETALAGRKDLDVYICGLQEMVAEVREWLKNAGFDRRQIHFERFD